MTFIKGGRFLLLLLACAALAERHKPMGKDKGHFKIVKSLLKECQAQGYAAPKPLQLQSIFSSSDKSKENGDNKPLKTLAQTFLEILDSINEDNKKADQNQFPVDLPNKMRNRMWNCSSLPIMVKKIKKSSESTVCYLRAFMAPFCFAALTTQCDDLNSDDHQALLWCVRINLPGKPLFNLSSNVTEENFKPIWMEMLESSFNSLSDSQRKQVARWTKRQILQKNCTTKPPSDSSSRKGNKDRCKSQVKSLDSDQMNIMGCFNLYLTSEDTASIPKEKLCDLVRLGCFKSITAKPKPSWAKMFLQKYKECIPGEEFQEHLDKLGPLACYLEDDLVPKVNLTWNTSSELLHQFEQCPRPTMRKRMKQFVPLLLPNASNALPLQDLYENMPFLSQKQMSAFPDHILSEVLKDKSLKWTRGQECLLVRKQKADKCNEMSFKNLTVLQSVVHGLPVCIFKKLKAEEFLEDSDAQEGLCETMTKAQLKALMKKMRPHLLKKRLPRCMPCIASLSSLQNETVNSLDEVEDKTWCKTQAAYWVEKTKGKLPVFGKLRSSIQGFGCEWIEKLDKSDLLEWVKAIANNAQWLSKSQARCSAKALFKTKKKNYFKTITEEELKTIPTFLLSFLRQELPDSVCPTFIEKMGKADLSLLPIRERSRPALAVKALHCVANGRKLSELTKEDMHRLGSMLCDQSPSILKLLTEEVLTETFELLANCSNIPKAHEGEMRQLLIQTVGKYSTWPSERMEKFGVLVLKDDEALSSLPNSPWLKDVLYFLCEKINAPSEALKKKVFELVTDISLSAKGSEEAAPGGQVKVVPTVSLIEELGPSNCQWRSSQLKMMTVGTFEATVEILGECPSYRADQLAVLTEKALKVFGPVSQMDPCQLVQLGCIAKGFSNSDLESLPFSLNSLKDIAHCRWTESQMESVWKGVAKRSSLTAQTLDAADTVELDQFIAGLEASEIAQLDVERFRNAVGLMSCFELSDEKKQQLRNLIVAAFGDPSTWSAAQVSDLAIIIPHLTEDDFANLKENAFPFLRMSCISFIPLRCIKRLSERQLKALGPDIAEMLTSSQRAVLSAKQLAALEEAETGSDFLILDSDRSRAPSLNVEGVVTFVAPLLFFFMGFLLL